jgi:hypothetical protein
VDDAKQLRMPFMSLKWLKSLFHVPKPEQPRIGQPETPKRPIYRINTAMLKDFPRNCPVIEETADGIPVGTCWFYLPDPDGKTCPRHGKVR